MKKIDKRKIDGKSQQYALVKKTTEELMNQVHNFEEVECKKSLNIKC